MSIYIYVYIWESMFFLHTQSIPHYHQFLGILSKYKYVRSHIATETQHNIVISDKFQLWFLNSLEHLNTMGRRNITQVSDFILMGLTDSEEIRLALFTLFLLIYLMTVLGNVGMILIIYLDSRLHTPMYFFLSHLSFLDLSYSSVITPKALDNLLTSNKHVSYLNCFIQMNCFVFLAVTQCFLLSSMAYDR